MTTRLRRNFCSQYNVFCFNQMVLIVLLGLNGQNNDKGSTNSEKIVKIGVHLRKLSQNKNKVITFLDHSVCIIDVLN